METRDEFAEAQVRRFLTVLFTNRARTHLRTMAAAYDWSPEQLTAYEQRFIQPAQMVPVWRRQHQAK
jgi:hypothetical protein